MKRRLLFVVGALCVAVTVAGADIRSRLLQENASPASADALKLRQAHQGTAAMTAPSYRSASGLHKIVIAADERERLEQARQAGALEIADYGSYRLFGVNQAQLERLNDSATEGELGASAAAFDEARRRTDSAHTGVEVRDDFNLLLLRAGAIDTTTEAGFAGVETALRESADEAATASVKQRERFTGKRLRLLQFAGPVKSEWLDELQAMGLELVAYVPSNGYLVREDATAHARLQSAMSLSSASSSASSAASSAAAGRRPFIQWEGEFHHHYKVHPELVSRQQRGEEVTIAIQFVKGKDRSNEKDERLAKKLANSLITDVYTLQNFSNLKLRVAAERLAELAALPTVVNIEPWEAPRLTDERANQIVAHEMNADGKATKAPGYLAWLAARSFASRFDFLIDVTDSGVDRGSTDAAQLHPDFKDANGQSRLAYARDYTTDRDPSDVNGHGTINLSIAGGFNNTVETRDAAGYNHGLGVAPFVGLGSSKIFDARGGFDLNEPFSNIIVEAYKSGARISSNSWGALTNAYSLDAQEYDVRTRDALPEEPGNQEMLFCFAAGNSGFVGTIGSPSSAKNVISVAASENLRQGAMDGCGVRDEDADNAHEIAFFSSGGFLGDGRIKPDITAPGTHMQGAASQHPDFAGDGVCGPRDIDKWFYPADQTLYTWSSGTSHSTPMVAGAAALARQFFLSRGEEPSVALLKAYLLNTTSYMSGARAAGDLPQERQGWGLLNLARLFDNTPKVFVNQSHRFSDSGQEFVMTGEIKDSSQPFRVTMAFTDAPGFSAFASWSNNLDMEVVVNGQTYRANNFKGEVSQPGGEFSIKDNVESVWLPAGTTGNFLVRIRATNIAGDGVPGNADASDQDFALVVYNGERKAVPVATFNRATVEGGNDAFADPGETVALKVNVKDISTVAFNNASATLSTTTAGVSVTTATVPMNNIAPGMDGDNAQPFVFALAPTIACGTVIDFVFELQAQGTSSRIPFTLVVGKSEAADFFADGIEAGEGQWTHGSALKAKKKRPAIDPWEITNRRFRSGARAWFAENPAVTADAHLDTQPIVLPANGRNLQLHFYHTFALEPGGFDGAVLEISTGDGFEDLGAKIVQGGYNGKVRNVESNRLAGRDAWVEGRIGAFQPVVVDLSSYAGKTVVIRFRIASDESFQGTGWYIDDVALKGNRVTCTGN